MFGLKGIKNSLRYQLCINSDFDMRIKSLAAEVAVLKKGNRTKPITGISELPNPTNFHNFAKEHNDKIKTSPVKSKKAKK